MKRKIRTWTFLGLEKTMEHEGDDYTNRDWCLWYSHKKIIKGTGRLGCWRTRGDYTNYNIIENDQNTEKSPGDVRRLTVTHTSVKDHQLTLMWKKTLIIIIITKGRFAFNEQFLSCKIYALHVAWIFECEGHTASFPSFCYQIQK